mmetsp:Transcript_7335/g.18548  ORF Transcript_7335/g.18548 Transcript_7335/m.18548 type:complete len:85 (+) Transcript_7335:95-349(+)
MDSNAEPKKSVHIPEIVISDDVLESEPVQYQICVDGVHSHMPRKQLWEYLGRLGVQDDPKYAKYRWSGGGLFVDSIERADDDDE